MKKIAAVILGLRISNCCTAAIEKVWLTHKSSDPGRVVANWQGRPRLDAIRRDGVHILMTAGDNVESIWKLGGAGVEDATEACSELIGA